MTKLDLKTTTEVIGGISGPSPRRCARLMRRFLKGSWRAGNTHARICN